MDHPKESSKHKRHRGMIWTAVAFAIWGLCPLAGCGPAEPTSEPASMPSPVSLDARDLLSQVLARYQNCSTYADNARAVLRSSAGGGSSTADETTAPLRVSLDGAQLSVDAYTLRFRVQSQTNSRNADRDLTAWFDEPPTSDFDHQVLRRTWSVPHDPTSTSTRLSIDNLLSDDVLRSRLSAGLAGPPPQLEWLLATDPMAVMFDSTSQFEHRSEAKINGRPMQRVSVLSKSERYVFWIDATQRLIRRVELPLPAALIATDPEASLSLELDDATFGRQVSRSLSWINEQPSRDRGRIVSRFVALPPTPPSPLIGRRLDANRLPNSADARLPSVIARLPSGQVAMEAALLMMAPAMASSPNWTLMVDQAEMQRAADRIVSGQIATTLVRDHESLVKTLRLPPDGIALVDHDGVILLVQTIITPTTVAAVMSARADAVAGVDVVARIREDDANARRRYESDLQRVIRSSRR